MPTETFRSVRVSRLVLVALAPSLMLIGCKPTGQAASASSAPPPLAALPLSSVNAPPITSAPTGSALPPAPPAMIGSLADPDQGYAYADQAYAMASALGDAPPDYEFDYVGGESPWVWQGDDQSLRIAEPLPDGGERYYYYQPGADAPYLIADPDYSYGFDNGVLVVVYDRSGHRLPPDMMRRQAGLAGRYFYRARDLYTAARQRQRQAVAENNWSARRAAVDAERAQWSVEQAQDSQWAAYHSAHVAQEQAHWGDEAYRRGAEAARFAQTIGDPQLAQRDWQAAQAAHAHLVQGGPPPEPQSGPPHGPPLGLPTGPRPSGVEPHGPPPSSPGFPGRPQDQRAGRFPAQQQPAQQREQAQPQDRRRAEAQRAARQQVAAAQHVQVETQVHAPAPARPQAPTAPHPAAEAHAAAPPRPPQAHPHPPPPGAPPHKERHPPNPDHPPA